MIGSEDFRKMKLSLLRAAYWNVHNRAPDETWAEDHLHALDSAIGPSAVVQAAVEAARSN